MGRKGPAGRLPDDIRPVDETICLMEQKWTLSIIKILMTGKMRFNELGAAVGGCNARTLSRRLRLLESRSLVARRVLSTIPPRVEYELTKKGRSFTAVMDSIVEWGRIWMRKP